MVNKTMPKTIRRLLIIAVLIALIPASCVVVEVQGGGMGGPCCVSCHNVTASGGSRKVDISVMSQTNSIHAGLNSGVNTSLNPDNKRCWACHGNGTEPSEHPDNYKDPYICPACHISGGSQVYKYNAPIVSEHYRSGTDIKAVTTASTDVLACLSCHQNVDEMVLPNSDPDYGHKITDVDKDGVKGGPNCTYHYGRKRTDLQIGTPPYTNCSYCHQNASTAFPFVNTDLNNLQNHTTRVTNPSCIDTSCHDSGRIHETALAKPSVDHTLCTKCHGDKSKHNGTVECCECHGNATNKIHPILYLTSDGTFSTSNASAVNCISCHQKTISYTGPYPPKVFDPLHHSEVNIGQRWGDYWTDDLSACLYCHDDTKHDTIALGRPAEWRGDNIVGSSVNDSYWCAGCHYVGYSNYAVMVSEFNTPGLPIPPEITNGMYAPNVTGFYEHVCDDWSDALCRECHGKFVTSYGVTELMHNVSDGSCGNCHYDFRYMNNTRHAPTKYVNSTMFNASVHGPSSGIGCVDCHTTSNHPYPEHYWKWCECCHAVQSNPVDDTDRHNVISDVRNNMVGGVSVLGIIDCKTCHNATSYESAKTNFALCRWCHTYPDKVYE